MKTVEVSRITDIPSQTIWNEMKHFDRVLNWVPGGNESSISVKGKGVGAIRDITLITQGYVQHELVAYSDKELSFSYKLTDGKPVGMQDYVVVAKIIPIDDCLNNSEIISYQPLKKLMVMKNYIQKLKLNILITITTLLL